MTINSCELVGISGHYLAYKISADDCGMKIDGTMVVYFTAGERDGYAWHGSKCDKDQCREVVDWLDGEHEWHRLG